MDTIQWWRCESCGARRIYGNASEPDGMVRRVLLMCARGCSRVHVPHTYVKSEIRRYMPVLMAVH